MGRLCRWKRTSHVDESARDIRFRESTLAIASARAASSLGCKPQVLFTGVTDALT